MLTEVTVKCNPYLFSASSEWNGSTLLFLLRGYNPKFKHGHLCYFGLLSWTGGKHWVSELTPTSPTAIKCSACPCFQCLMLCRHRTTILATRKCKPEWGRKNWGWALHIRVKQLLCCKLTHMLYNLDWFQKKMVLSSVRNSFRWLAVVSPSMQALK